MCADATAQNSVNRPLNQTPDYFLCIVCGRGMYCFQKLQYTSGSGIQQS